jgi:hypothetical protein
MASRLFPGNKVTSFPPTKEAVNTFTVENVDSWTNGTRTGTFTVPQGVTKIFATLMGGAGSPSDISFVHESPLSKFVTGSNFGNTISMTGAANGENTSITVNGTTYSSVGGAKGEYNTNSSTANSVSEPLSSILFMGAINQNKSVGSFENSNFELVSAKPNVASCERFASSSISVSFTSADTNMSQSLSLATIAYPGFSAPTEKYEISVTPGTSITYSVGKSGGSGSTGGALYITY